MPRIVAWSEADGPVADFASRLRAEHGGETVDIRDGQLSAALVAGGASVGRRSFLMALDPLPEALDRGPFDGRVTVMRPEPERCAPALLHAFPPDHPDYDPAIADVAGAERAMASYFSGTVIGPFLADASSEATDLEGRVVGGIVIGRMPSDGSSPGGPWVTEVFVEPDQQGRGVGRALFARAVSELRAVGDSSLRLAVQVDNPARRLYARLGFATDSAWSRITL